jgi:hypothetical protein
MSSRREERRQASFRFDPHPGGSGPLGLGMTRSVALGAVLALGMLCLYEGRLVTAAFLLILGAPVVLARWQGLPLATWLILRAAYLLLGPRRWEVDPERVGMSEPLALAPGDEAVERGNRRGQ